MTTLLYLVRHGETASNAEGLTQGRRDVPLNDHGRRQARALAERLRGVGVSAVVSSPSARALDTAEAIAALHGLEAEPDERWSELDQGILDGLSGEQLRAEHPEFLRAWRQADPADLRMPGGETMREAQQRMVAAAEEVARRHPDATVVSASHNLAIRALLCHALGAPLAGFRRLRQDLSSLSVVEVRLDAPWSVLRINDVCHVPAEPRAIEAESARAANEAAT